MLKYHIRMAMDGVDLVWVRKHLNGEFTDICTFTRKLQEVIDKGTENDKAFMWTVASTKYRWDWITADQQKTVLTFIQDVLTCRAIVPGVEENADPYRGSINTLRTYLQSHGWVLI